MEVARKLLIIYYRNYHCLKKVAQFGNIIYNSRKLNYAYMYVDEKKAKFVIEKIKKIHHVTKVELSLNEIEEFSFSL